MLLRHYNNEKQYEFTRSNMEGIYTMKILNARQVAEMLGISYDTALAFLKSGAVACKKIGRQYLVEESKLEEFFGTDGFLDVKLEDLDVYNYSRPTSGIKLRRRK